MIDLPVTIDDIRRAERAIAGEIVRTPLIRAAALSEIAGVEVFLKLETTQATGSFEMIDETDASGAVVFCGVLADQPLVVTEPGADGIGARTLLEITPRRGSVIGRVIRRKVG